jgi:hypothetical protein
MMALPDGSGAQGGSACAQFDVGDIMQTTRQDTV